MPCQYKWKQLLNVTGALRELAPSSYLSSLSGYTDLLNLRGQLLEQVIGPYPRIATLLGTITGLSQGPSECGMTPRTAGWPREELSQAPLRSITVSLPRRP